MQILQKNIICRKISFVIPLCAEEFIAYIELNPVFTLLLHLWPGDVEHFSGSTNFFLIATLIFDDCAKFSHCCVDLAAAPSTTTVAGGNFFCGIFSKFLRDSVGNSYCKKD